MSEFISHYIEHCRGCGEYLGEDSINVGECINCDLPFSAKQRSYALRNPKLYESEVTLTDGEVTTVVAQAEYLDLQDRILKVFGLFAITEAGIECLDHEYYIENSRLNEIDWVSHMEDKLWVNIEDFKKALAYAKSRYKST